MTAPPRPTPAELERHCCRVGHRWGEPENAFEDRYCVDCGAMRRRISRDDGWVGYWPPNAPDNAIRQIDCPPCPAADEEGK